MQSLTESDRDALRRNLDEVRSRIAIAADKAGRDPDDVGLVAVTKKRPTPVIEALLDLGVDAIGENRPEEIVRKQDELGELDVPWHMIGHFQRKKIGKTLRLLDMVHSVHSLRLLATLDVRALEQVAELGRLPVLIQVNASGEPSKQGFRITDVRDVLDIAEGLVGVQPAGLMTMAPYEADDEELERLFDMMRDLQADLGPERVPELSMGMSRDFESAIRAGATMVRIGSALFEGVAGE